MDGSISVVGGSSHASRLYVDPLPMTGGVAKPPGGIQVRDIPAHASAPDSIVRASKNARTGEGRVIAKLEISAHQLVDGRDGLGRVFEYLI